MQNPLTALADAASRWATCPLPGDVDWDARRAILDWFASMLPGTVSAPATNLSALLASARGAGNAVNYVDGQRCAARHAALMNGTASHTAEFDDIYRDGGYHPGCTTIAAALAVAQDRDVSYEAFRRSVIGGYEAGCRIALALQPSHYRNWHITATVGTIGAAVSTAMLLRCDPDRIAHAIAIATSFAGGHQENLQGGGLVKPLHCGHAAEAGVLAGYAAAAGVNGSLDSLHAPHGYAAATSESTGNWDAALSGLGEWTPISRMTFKFYGCCGHIFPALDGIRAIWAKEVLDVESVASVEVSGYSATRLLCDRMKIDDARDARFSLQYCVSDLLHGGAVRLSSFSPDALARPSVRNFMNRVTVREDAELSAAYPVNRMARIKLALRDGRVLEHTQKTRKGDPESPLTDEELFDKFDELAATVLDDVSCGRLKDMVMAGKDLPFDLARSPMRQGQVSYAE
jgi:2-methylcitrate dehydratase PrpD